MRIFSSKVNCTSNVRSNSLYDLSFGDEIIIVTVRGLHEAALLHIGATLVQQELNKLDTADFYSSTQRCTTVLVWSSSYRRPFLVAQTPRQLRGFIQLVFSHTL